MPSVISLRDVINQQLSDLESKRKLATDLMNSAAEHEARGDEVKAKLDRDSAERYLRDVEGIEKTIAGYQSDIQHREQKAAEIDRRIADLRARFDRDFKALDDDKESILAGLAQNGNNFDAARRAIKDRNLNKKQQQLEKDFHRDLDKLEREKQMILG